MKLKTTQLIKKQLIVLLFFVGLSAFSQAPTITSFSPSKITFRTTVTINGTGFTTAMASTPSSVKFNGTNATAVTYVSATQIKAIVPSGVTSGAITVTTANGTVNSSTNYTYVTPVATPASAVVSRIITDYNGYWSTNTTTNSSVQPITHTA